METIIQDVLNEVQRQRAKWGVQNHPILSDALEEEFVTEVYNIPSEKYVKDRVDLLAKNGGLSYFDILLEEVVEVANCNNAKDLRTELIQVTAVALSMIESLDRNGR